MAYQKQMKKILDTTTNSRAYKLARRARITGNCPMCKPHRGCNSRVYIRKNWKHYFVNFCSNTLLLPVCKIKT